MARRRWQAAAALALIGSSMGAGISCTDRSAEKAQVKSGTLEQSSGWENLIWLEPGIPKGILTPGVPDDKTHDARETPLCIYFSALKKKPAPIGEENEVILDRHSGQLELIPITVQGQPNQQQFPITRNRFLDITHHLIEKERGGVFWTSIAAVSVFAAGAMVTAATGGAAAVVGVAPAALLGGSSAPFGGAMAVLVQNGKRNSKISSFVDALSTEGENPDSDTITRVEGTSQVMEMSKRSMSYLAIQSILTVAHDPKSPTSLQVQVEDYEPCEPTQRGQRMQVDDAKRIDSLGK
jgi:hypothetical protein